MANLLILEPTLSDGAQDAYYASSEQAAAPWSNLFTRQPKEVGESTTVASTLELRFDLAHSIYGTSGISYNTLALLFTNATSAATITWAGSTSSTFGTTAWSSGPGTLIAPGQTYYPRPHAFTKLSATQTARYVRCQISDTTNPDGVFRAGRFYCGAGYQPTVNVQFPFGFGFDDISPEVVTSNGERIIRPIEPIPKIAFRFQAMGSGAEAEFQANIHELMRRVGASRDVLVHADPADATYGGRKIYYGTLQAQQVIALDSYQFYQAAFELRGLI